MNGNVKQVGYCYQLIILQNEIVLRVHSSPHYQLPHYLIPALPLHKSFDCDMLVEIRTQIQTQCNALREQCQCLNALI